MISEREATQIDCLIKKFMKSFWINILILPTVVIMFIIIFASVTYQYVEGKEELMIVILFLCIVIGSIVVMIKGTRPFIKDFWQIKSGNFHRMTGKVIKYRKVIHAGDPTTISYYPTLRDVNSEWIELEVNADDTEINQTYRVIYLPNTKFAVCEKD